MQALVHYYYHNDCYHFCQIGQHKPITLICLQKKKKILSKGGQINVYPIDFPEAITQADAQLTSAKSTQSAASISENHRPLGGLAACITVCLSACLSQPSRPDSHPTSDGPTV